MIRCKYYKKIIIIIIGNNSLVTAFWEDIFITCIALKPLSIILLQFYPGDLASFADSAIIFFSIASLIIRSLGQFVALPRWA